MKRVAAVLWSVIAVAVGTGCFPVYVSLVKQGITTGDRLAAIDRLQKDPGAGGANDEQWAAQVPDRCDALRKRLLAGPPNMRASISAKEGTTWEEYSSFNPGLYSPVSVERDALKRALQAGAITKDEYAELDSTLAEQAKVSLLRRRFETASVAVEGSSLGVYFGGASFTPYTALTCQEYASDSWLPYQLGRWNDRGRPASPYENPPPYFNEFDPSFWIDPNLPCTSK